MLKEAKLLLVDDDDALRQSLRDQPEFYKSFSIDEASSGSEALEFIKRKTYELVLLDVGLPDMDGRSVCRSMRSASVNACIILMTGADTEANTSASSEAGADDYVTKPFKLGNLLSRIDALLNHRDNIEDGIFNIGHTLFDDFDKEGDDWAVGWILQVLKKHKPIFFKNEIFNKWFHTYSNENINYEELQLMLLEQKFESADRLTSAFLRKLAGNLAEKRGYVFYSEVGKMSGKDLETIDRLWNIYSNGRFGFSNQAKILKSLGKKYELLWPKIGWKKEGLWTRYPNSFCWSLKAPDGHMPLINQLRGVRLMDSILRHPAIAERHNNIL